MNWLFPMRFRAGLTLLALLALLLLAGQHLQAATPSVPAWEGPQLAGAPAAALLLADDEGWSIKKLWGGVNNRTRVVQVCIVTMCLALLILIKK